MTRRSENIVFTRGWLFRSAKCSRDFSPDRKRIRIGIENQCARSALTVHSRPYKGRVWSHMRRASEIWRRWPRQVRDIIERGRKRDCEAVPRIICIIASRYAGATTIGIGSDNASEVFALSALLSRPVRHEDASPCNWSDEWANAPSGLRRCHYHFC